MNPYLIQDLPAQIGVSGGRTSGFMFFHILAAHGGKLPPEIIPTFQNTGEECEETLDFIHEIETRWFPITWLEWADKFNVEDYRKSDGTISEKRLRGQNKAFKIVSYATASRQGEPFEKMLQYYWDYRAVVKGETKILPTLVTRMCTSHLKIKTSERYMASLGFRKFFRVPGIRYDEPRRWNGRQSDVSYMPLVEAKVTKKDVNNWWRKQKFNLQLDEESIEGNCRHCFLKHPDKAIAIIKKRIQHQKDYMPDAELQRWLDRESLTGLYFRRDRPSYRQLYDISVEELISGRVGKYDFSLVPEFKCECGGTTNEEDDGD